MGAQEFELVVYYPDGHVEVIEETFVSVEKAKEYGVNMLNQIKATESYHADKHGILGGSKRHKAHFEVCEVGSHKVVCEGK